MFTSVGEAIPNLGANIEAFILLRTLSTSRRLLSMYIYTDLVGTLSPIVWRALGHA